MQIYFTVAHDPTQLNRQGPDEGTQYRSDVFASSDAQQLAAKAYIAELDKAHAFTSRIVTKVEPLQAFYRAEAFHQNYAMLHPSNSYIAGYDLPKVANLKKLYPALYREQAVFVGGSQELKKGVLTVHRREILLMLASAAAAGADPPAWLRAEAEEWEVTKTDEEWRRLLTPAQYQVLRHEDTEPPSSSPLVDEHRAGVFVCAGCELPLFKSETKFESGTGWPSFWSPIEGSVGTKTDRSLWMERTEVHCRRCGGHLGHVFKDGPPPTGLRYCMNGVALKFVPEAS